MPARLLTALLAATLIAPAAGAAGIEAGLWEVREADAAPRRLCVRDLMQLMQLRHGERSCARLPIAADRFGATIHYSCPGAGWGRTTIRFDTGRAARIDTQGIADDAPFAFAAEARRLGPCPAMAQR